MRKILLPFLALPLAACGGGGGEAPAANVAAPAAVETGFQDQVAKLDPAQRNGVFIRAIRDAGHDCQGVTESSKQDQPGLWSARCDNGAGYGVLIGADGTAQVIAAR